MHAERPLSSATGDAARRQPHADRSRQAALRRAASSTRASWTARSRGVFNGKIIVRPDAQKTDAQADEQEPAALGRRAGQLEAAARDLRRRREVHARLDDRAARRRRDVLPALARDRRARRRASLLIYAFAERRRSSASASRRCARARRSAARSAAARATRTDPRRARMSTSAESRARQGRRPAFDVEARPPRLPDPRAQRSTASRSSTSTTPRRRRSRRRSSTRCARYYRADNANIHRGVHTLSSRRRPTPTRRRARRSRAFLNAAETRARSSSSAARPRRSTSWRRPSAGSTSAPGDEVLITALEHHSNIVPWQLLCEEKGAQLRVAADRPTRASCASTSSSACSRRARSIVAVAHVSNALGTVNPVRRDRRAGARARRPGARRRRAGGRRTCRSTCRRSAATSTRSPATRCTARRHRRALRAGGAARGDAALPGRRRHDPLGHVREDDLQRAALQVRGGHAEHRRRDRPRRRDRLSSRRSGSSAIAAHEHELLAYATERAAADPGPAHRSARRAEKAGVLSFVLDGVHPHDIGTVLDREGDRDPHRPPLRAAGDGALRRAGDRARVARRSTTRATEIDALVDGLHKVQRMFR